MVRSIVIFDNIWGQQPPYEYVSSMQVQKVNEYTYIHRDAFTCLYIHDSWPCFATYGRHANQKWPTYGHAATNMPHTPVLYSLPGAN